MIRERELLEAIRECEEPPITPAKCQKLANFYIIYNQLFGGVVEGRERQVEKVISIEEGDSEFLRLIDGMSSAKVWPVINELMSTLQAAHPRAYEGVLTRLWKAKTDP